MCKSLFHLIHLYHPQVYLPKINNNLYFDKFKGTQQHKVICIRLDVTIISNMSFSLINERILWATIFNMLIKAVYCLIKMSTWNSKMYCSFCCGTLLSTESNVEIHNEMHETKSEKGRWKPISHADLFRV